MSVDDDGRTIFATKVVSWSDAMPVYEDGATYGDRAAKLLMPRSHFHIEGHDSASGDPITLHIAIEQSLDGPPVVHRDPDHPDVDTVVFNGEAWRITGTGIERVSG